MKKILCVMLVLLVFAVLLCSCDTAGRGKKETTENTTAEKTTEVTTTEEEEPKETTAPTPTVEPGQDDERGKYSPLHTA